MQPPLLLKVTRRSLTWLVILSLMAVPGTTTAVAQEDPLTEAGPPVEAPILQQAFDELPPVPLTVRLLRIALEPGASVPTHTHPGLEFNIVESGTLSVVADGDVRVRRAGEDEDADAPARGEPFDLAEGDSITYAASTEMALSNEAEEDSVTLLAAVILPLEEAGISYVDGEPTDDDFAGVRNQILGDGAMIDIPTGPYTVAIEQLVLDEGESIPAFSGPALLSMGSGFFGFTVDQGAVQVTRTEEPALVPNAEEGEEFTLAAGDAAFFPNGMNEVARDDTTSELELLRFAILPEATAAAEEAEDATPAASATEPPATITFSPEPEETPEPTEEPTEEPAEEAEPAAEIGEGATVVVSTEVNLRPGPSTAGDVITILPVGQVLIVTGPAEEGDGFVWFPVQSVDDPSITGYVAADYIALAEE